MSFYNPSKNPFPFYDLEGSVWTNFKPKWHRNNCRNYQHTLNPGIRYFQLPLSTSVTSQSDISAIELRFVSDNSIVSASISRVIYSQGESKTLVLTVELTNAMTTDNYYISVATNYGNYYSETFCIKPVDKNNIEIQWRSSTSVVGKLIYPIEVKQSINLNAKVVLLEPQIEEETEENGYGEETATLQILTQPYFLSCVVPNFLGEAISAIQLHDQIIVNNTLVGESETELYDSTKIISVKVTPEENLCDSYVEITFSKESIIKTTCEGQIIALNNAPLADIVWNDSRTTEDRECSVENTCNVVMLSTEYTTDIDGDTLTLDWERSIDNGVTWASIGSGGTKSITETIKGTYIYRLKATDSYGLFGYSNILKYNLFDVNSSSVLSDIIRIPSNCGDAGIAYSFNINGVPNTSVRFQMKVTFNYGHGFEVTIWDRNIFSSVWGRSSGPVNSTYAGYLLLNNDGVGEYRIHLCLRPCLATLYNQGGIEFTLFEVDEVTISDQTISLMEIMDCE